MSSSGDERSGEPVLSFAWNVPNILTISRLVLVPVFAIVTLTHPHQQGWRVLATAIFILAILTDWVDGRVARRFNMVTNFGKIWDSIADKALTGMAFLALAIVGELPWWFVVIILLREWGITALRFQVLKYGVMAAKMGGKLKTTLQALALVLFLLWLPGEPTWYWLVRWIIMWAAFALTVGTGIDYVLDAIRLRAESLRAGHPIDYGELVAERRAAHHGGGREERDTAAHGAGDER